MDLGIVSFDDSVNLTGDFKLDYPEIPDSCLLDRLNIHIVKLRHHSLRQSDILTLLTQYGQTGGIDITRPVHLVLPEKKDRQVFFVATWDKSHLLVQKTIIGGDINEVCDLQQQPPYEQATENSAHSGN